MILQRLGELLKKLLRTLKSIMIILLFFLKILNIKKISLTDKNAITDKLSVFYLYRSKSSP